MALMEVRASFAALAVSADLGDTRPVALSQRLGLHKSLARKLSHLMTAESALQVWECIPGEHGIAKAIAACEKAGASSDAADRVGNSLRELKNTVESYATNSAEFRRMLAQIPECQSHETEAIAREDRERAYEGAAATLGVSVDTAVRIDVLSPAKADGDADLITSKGVVNLTRLRRGSEIELGRASIEPEGVGKPATLPREPLDGQMRRGDPPLWRRLTTVEPSRVRRLAVTDQVVADRVGETPTGLPGRCDIFFAERVAGMGNRFRADGLVYGQHTHRVRFPAKMNSMTLILHRSLAGREPEASVHSIVTTDPGDTTFDWESTRLPLVTQVRDLGPRLSWASTCPYGAAESAIDELISATGFSRDDFLGYRVDIEYPPVFSAVRLQYELPSR